MPSHLPEEFGSWRFSNASCNWISYSINRLFCFLVVIAASPVTLVQEIMSSSPWPWGSGTVTTVEDRQEARTRWHILCSCVWKKLLKITTGSHYLLLQTHASTRLKGVRCIPLPQITSSLRCLMDFCNWPDKQGGTLQANGSTLT